MTSVNENHICVANFGYVHRNCYVRISPDKGKAALIQYRTHLRLTLESVFSRFELPIRILISVIVRSVGLVRIKELFNILKKIKSDILDLNAVFLNKLNY